MEIIVLCGQEIFLRETIAFMSFKNTSTSWLHSAFLKNRWCCWKLSSKIPFQLNEPRQLVEFTALKERAYTLRIGDLFLTAMFLFCLRNGSTDERKLSGPKWFQAVGTMCSRIFKYFISVFDFNFESVKFIVGMVRFKFKAGFYHFSIGYSKKRWLIV